MYRVVHLGKDNLLLTLKLELCFSIKNLYCGRAFNCMSTNCIPRPHRPPCIFFLWDTRVHFFCLLQLCLIEEKL